MLFRSTIIAWCFVLASCQCGQVEEGRYQCDPKIQPKQERADAPQCPGNSRCGLEGYCHKFGDVSIAWRCDTSDNCENGYDCGLSRDRSFRECHNPDAVDAGFSCEVETDCVRGWHCGVAKVCYDRAQKSAYPCRRNLGNADCSPTWRCGLDSTCHDTGFASNYRCEADTDCEQGWRCGLEQKCLDPGLDALRLVNTTLGAPEKINPLLIDHTPELFAVSPVQSPSFNEPRQSFAFYDRNQVTVLDLAVGGIPAIGSNPHRLNTVADAGEVTAIATLGSFSLSQLAKVDVGSWTYLTRPDGGFQELHFRNTVAPAFGFDGTPYRTMFVTNGFEVVNTRPNRIHVGSTEKGFVPTLTAYNRAFEPAVGWNYYYGWGARSSATLPVTSAAHRSDYAYFGNGFAVGSNRIVDIATLTGHWRTSIGYLDQLDCSVIADSRGLFVHDNSTGSGGFFTVTVPVVVPPFHNQFCEAETGLPQSFRITGLRSVGRDWLAVSANPMDGGVAREDDHRVALIDARAWWDEVTPGGLVQPFRGCFPGYNAKCAPYVTSSAVDLPVSATTVVGPCRVCTGGSLVALSAFPTSASGPKLEARCRSGHDGGLVDSISEVTQPPSAGASCLRKQLQLSSSLGSDPVQIATGNSEQLAFAGPRGHLWVGQSSATAFPAFFDEAPSGVVSDSTGLPIFIGPDRIGWFVGAPFGVLAFPLDPADGESFVAVVEGASSAAVTAGRALVTFDGVEPGGLPKALAAADGTPTRFDAPYHAIKARRTDGADVVLVSAGDVLLAANLNLGRPVLERRIVPSEGKAIVSMVALPKSGGTPLLTAFALTANGLFKITAESDQLWSSSAAQLPAGEAIELWADGARGRIGYADGRVFSLETRVQIGEALKSRVDDYAQVCGQAYALAAGELYRLGAGPAGSAVGRWEPVPLSSGLPASELLQGKLVPFTAPDAGTTLHVFSRRGEAIRMPVNGCN